MAKLTRTEREAALIAAARQELASGQTQPSVPLDPSPRVVSRPAPVEDAGRPIDVTLSVQPDIATRIALLMQAEQEEKLRRTKRLRQIGVVIPAALLVTAILWVVTLILRYFLR